LEARVIVFPDEPAHALASRLARRNGVHSLASFGGDMAVKFYAIIQGRRNREVAALAKADVAILDRATFVVVDSDRVRLGDELLHFDDWSYRSLRICPACLAQDIRSEKGDPKFRAHVRAWWNLTRIEVCPIHRIRMLDCDPADPEKVVDHQALDVRFAAGPQCDFAAAEIRSVDVEDVRAESYILGRLKFIPRIRTAILDDIPLWNAIRLMDRFGAVAAGGAAGHTSLGGHVAKRDALASGYAIFAEGKESLFRFLDALVGAAEVKGGKWGPRRAYGRIYKWLSHDTRDHVYDPVRELVREHIIANIPLAADEEVFGRLVGARHLYTLWDASQEIGQHHDMLRRTLVALKHMTAEEAARDNCRVVLSSDQVKNLKALLQDRLNYTQARSYLGLPRGPMQSLFDEGLLKPFLATEAGVSEYMFRKRELDAFILTLLADAPSVARLTGDLCNIVDAGKHGQTSTAEIVRSILEGKLKSAARHKAAKSFMQILVRLSDVKALRRHHTISGITIDEARAVLGITHPVIRALINAGHLKTVTVVTRIRNHKQELIKPESFEKFRQTFITATEVAVARGTHVRTLVPSLMTLGIKPAIGNVDVGQYFYARADLPNA
jgi:hypothetical protein